MARPFGARVGFARAGVALEWSGLGTMATGAATFGAVAIRSLDVKRGKIGRLSIEEVGRLRVRELIVDQEQEQEA